MWQGIPDYAPDLDLFPASLPEDLVHKILKRFDYSALYKSTDVAQIVMRLDKQPNIG